MSRRRNGVLFLANHAVPIIVDIRGRSSIHPRVAHHMHHTPRARLPHRLAETISAPWTKSGACRSRSTPARNLWWRREDFRATPGVPPRAPTVMAERVVRQGRSMIALIRISRTSSGPP